MGRQRPGEGVPEPFPLDNLRVTPRDERGCPGYPDPRSRPQRRPSDAKRQQPQRCVAQVDGLLEDYMVLLRHKTNPFFLIKQFNQ